MNKKFNNRFNNIKKSKAQAYVEYLLILAYVSIVTFTVLQGMGNQIKNTVQTLADKLNQANQTAQTSSMTT